MDICGDVESLGELLHNLEFVERTVAPNTNATCLIMPSQAYMRHVISQRPDASREELIATFKVLEMNLSAAFILTRCRV